jgi:threonyl-tRNA synthetase
MAPVQAVLLPINDELISYAQEVGGLLSQAGVRIEVDDRSESLNKKIREAQLQNIPLMVTIGAKEKEAGTLAVRTLDGKVKYGVGRQAFIEAVTDHVRQRKLELDLFG